MSALLLNLLRRWATEPAFDHPAGHAPRCHWCELLGETRAALAQAEGRSEW